MPDLLDKGSQWLDQQRHAHMTRSVTYRRGHSTIVVQATVGRTTFEQADQFGVIHRIESRDYLIRAEDLALNGTAILPQSGDRIIEANGDQIYTYEVMTPTATGEPPFRFSDPYRRTLRVHTKHVGTTTGESN